MIRNSSSRARPSAQMLAFLYTKLRWGCPDIAYLYERDASTIRGWLLQAGIPTRPRGTPHAGSFKAGQRGAFTGRRHRPESIEKVRAATIARDAVPYLRGGQHWLKGAAADANPNWKGGATPERQEFYHSPEWKAACRAVWARDNACCRNCGKDWRDRDELEPAFHVHHVVSFQDRRWRAHPAFLVLLCRQCHLWVHSKANTTRAWLPQEPGATHFPSLDDLVAIPPADAEAWAAAESRGRAAYFADQVHYLLAAEREASMPTLFDLEEVQQA